MSRSYNKTLIHPIKSIVSLQRTANAAQFRTTKDTNLQETDLRTPPA
jgi:hypothetical protein